MLINDYSLTEQKGPMILIVDDTSIDLQVLAMILGKDGYQIAAAVNGKQALDIIGNISPDLILLDIMMPGMDGFKVCKILKSSLDKRDIPIIFLTVKDEMADILSGYEAGAVDYVTKPFNSAELLARVRTHVELKKKRDNEKDLISRLTVALSEQKRVEDALQQAHDNLERLVEERTVELVQKNRQLMEEIAERRRAEDALAIKSRNLEESNTALKVLLTQREKDKEDLEERVLSNIKNLIMPHIEKLKRIHKKTGNSAHLKILESNLKDITSSFSHKISSKYLNLTTKEIQIAQFVKEGRSSKDIGEMMNVSERTIDFHRKNIRIKLGIKNRKGNLRSCLLNIS
jgi:DNA-binding response OmpR family regulator/DNA-binding CsgD family transcriptional regulator